MNTTMIECFMAAVKTLNFTVAAECVHITQPALSRQIVQLEEQVGFPLFFRSKKNGLRVTPAGLEYYNGLKKIKNEYKELLKYAESINRGESGGLVIGVATGSCVGSKTLKSISKFKEAYPNMMVTLKCYSLSGLIDAAINGECDIVFTISSVVKDIQNLLSENIFQVDNYMYVPNKLQVEAKKEYSLCDFKDQTFIMSEEVPVINTLLTELCKNAGFMPNMIMAPDYETKMLWCEMGLGLAINNEDHYMKNSPMVSMVKIKELKPDSYAIVWNKTNYNSGIALFYSMFCEFMNS